MNLLNIFSPLEGWLKKVFKCNLIISDVTFIFLGTFLIKYWNHRTTVEFAMIRTGIRLER